MHRVYLPFPWKVEPPVFRSERRSANSLFPKRKWTLQKKLQTHVDPALPGSTLQTESKEQPAKTAANSSSSRKQEGETKMRCMVIVKANKDSEAGILPSTELLASMGKFNEELVKAGVMLAGEGLKPSSHGKRVTFTAGKPTITDGPFAETKELVAGFWIWQVRSIEEAVEWLKRSPFGPGAELEIRPVFEAEDFGPNLTPELKEREDRLRKQIGEKKSSNPLKKSFDALSIL
jgi:hypothetical protein